MTSVKPDPAALAFRRERLLALGVLAFLAPIPLVFSFAVETGWLALYLGAVALFLFFVARGRIPCLSLFTLNLAGLAYAVLFWVDLRYGSRRLLFATVHLLLFTTVVKLASVRKERDLATTLALIGFLFLASVATSIHYAIFLFLALFLGVAWPLLVRWGLWRDLSGAEEEWRRDPDARALPGRRATALSVLATLLCAAPLFFALPRLKAPLVRGVSEVREISTGFSESVDPDLFGILKRSDKVYLRVTADVPITSLGLEELRLRALAFDTYDGRAWQKPQRTAGFSAAPPGVPVPLPGVPPRELLDRRALGIDLLPLESRFVPYPGGSPGIRFAEGSFRGLGWAMVTFDAARNVLLPMTPERTIHYEAFFGGTPARDLAAPGPRDPSRRALGSPKVAEWARSAIGGVDPEADPERAAGAIQRLLATTYSYTLEVPRAGPHPTEEFLLARRSGHCENFASAMALALRELGIPSRFVTGFAGGELGLLDRYLIVRGRDAHSWVEAWCGPEKGWLAFDPTPAAGRPGVERVPLSQRLRQIGDGIELLYDRYVLSFGQGDQLEMVRRVREGTAATVERVRSALDAMRRVDGIFRRGGAAAILLAVVLALAYATLRAARRGRSGFRERGPLPPAAAAYRRVQRALRRRGGKVGPASSPAETLAAARPFGAHAHRCAAEIVTAYAASSFGGIALDEEGERRIAARLKSFENELKKRAA